ncbi:MAG: ACP S-malonyltransferase [Chloroflexi bacterium]|nr:ACP S-malonyltransferase [Chloroflexota bacterium]
MNLSPETTAFLFPGQGSQAVGMGRALGESCPLARQVFEQADAELGFPLSRLLWEGPEEALNDTINTQPALFVHSLAALSVFMEIYPRFTPAYVAGHSMGELSALAASGALSFRDGLTLVRRRGELMKRAGEVSPGGMAAILGLDIPTLDALCAQASSEGEIVQVANDNCPGQVVISGASLALQRAMVLAEQAKARRVIPLAVSIAAHSPLMLNAQNDFNLAVQAAAVAAPHIPVIGNVTAQPLNTPDEIRLDLQAQLTSRVRWTETIQFLASQGVSHFIEMGNGSVLGGLVKRIDRSAVVYTLGAPEDLDKLASIS